MTTTKISTEELSSMVAAWEAHEATEAAPVPAEEDPMVEWAALDADDEFWDGAWEVNDDADEFGRLGPRFRRA